MKKYIFITALFCVGMTQAADQFAVVAQKARKRAEIEFHASYGGKISDLKTIQWADLITNYKLPVNERFMDLSVDDQTIIICTQDPNNTIIVRAIDAQDRIVETIYEANVLKDYLPQLNQKQTLVAVAGASAVVGSLATLAATKKCTIL